MLTFVTFPVSQERLLFEDSGLLWDGVGGGGGVCLAWIRFCHGEGGVRRAVTFVEVRESKGDAAGFLMIFS